MRLGGRRRAPASRSGVTTVRVGESGGGPERISPGLTAVSDVPDSADRPAAHPTRLRGVAGGFGLLLSILGFLAVRAVVTATPVADDWVLVALPAFGLVGLVSFVALVTAFVPAE